MVRPKVLPILPSPPQTPQLSDANGDAQSLSAECSHDHGHTVPRPARRSQFQPGFPTRSAILARIQVNFALLVIGGDRDPATHLTACPVLRGV